MAKASTLADEPAHVDEHRAVRIERPDEVTQPSENRGDHAQAQQKPHANVGARSCGGWFDRGGHKSFIGRLARCSTVHVVLRCRANYDADDRHQLRLAAQARRDRARFDELQGQLNDPAVHSNSARLIAISKESGQIEPVVEKYRAYRKALEAASELRELSNGADKEMSELAIAELPDAESRATALLEELKDEFLAAEDNAVDSFFLEIRAGTGGDEAGIFAGNLFEMYRQLLRDQALAV